MMIEDTMIQCKQVLEEADMVLVGAGAGLSTSAGLRYSGPRFTDNFADFVAKYPLTDMYSSMFYPFATAEERWAYVSRHIDINRYGKSTKVYEDLLHLVEQKPHFVITTNVDGQFLKAGFAKQNLFMVQGDYAYLQCSQPCHDGLYDNREMVEKMVALQQDCRVPKELLPICPRCGEAMEPHLRADHTFVQNKQWYEDDTNYRSFLKAAKGQNLVLLELGVGFNTPSIIRWPFEQMTATDKRTTLIRINMDEVTPDYAIGEGNLLLKGDIADYLDSLLT